MKFVHLAPNNAVSRIKRSGIRAGNGQCGRGVYCVPLLMLPKRSFHTEELEEESPDSVYISDPVSTATIWKWLYRKNHRHGNNARPIAVLFTIPSHLWPVDLYLWIYSDISAALRERLGRCGPGYSIPEDQYDLWSKFGAWGVIIRISVTTEAGVGHIIKSFREVGGMAISDCDETIEIVIRGPIPARNIIRFVPLSQTIKEFRERRNNRAWDE